MGRGTGCQGRCPRQPAKLVGRAQGTWLGSSPSATRREVDDGGERRPLAAGPRERRRSGERAVDAKGLRQESATNWLANQLLERLE